MDDTRFDRLTQILSHHLDRRRLNRLGVGALGIVGGMRASQDETEARKRRNKRKCQPGLLTCKLKRKKKKALIFCKDGQNDPFNCGACGNTCATGQNCLGGVCTCNGTLCTGCCDGNACQAGSSNQLCGANGTVCQICTGGSSCQNGVCTCPTGQTYCGGACVDTKVDPANCGACGTTCTLPQTCGGGGVDNVCGCRADGFVFPDQDNCDPCCSGNCCFESEGFSVCAGGCG